MSSLAHAAQPNQPAHEPVMVHFGDIRMTEHWLVTPQGTFPLAGTQVFVADLSREERYVPSWAIAMAPVGFVFFFLGVIGFLFAILGLLFLFVKETRLTGFMQITVTNGEFTFQTGEPARGDRAAQLDELQHRTSFARHLIVRAAA